MTTPSAGTDAGARRDAAGRPAVVHVVPYFPPDRIGGVGEVAAHLHEALVARGHRSRVLTSGRARSESAVLRVGRTPARFALACVRGLRLAREADVLHVHQGEAFLLLLLARLLRIRTPVLLTLHVSAEGLRRSLRPFRHEGRRIRGDRRGALERLLHLRLRHLLDRGAMALAQRVTFISRSTARDHLPPAAAEAAHVIYNGLPEPAPAAGPRPERTELLYVGTHSLRKRVALLPDVLAGVRRSRPEARLRIVGFTPAPESELVRRARALGVEAGLVLEGAMPSSEVARFYAASDVLLVPSAYEGLPMVILEAQQAGLPCVATRVSGHAELLEDGVNGHLVPVDRPEAMARAALEILEDPARAHRMAAAARARVAERFGLAEQLEAYLALYRAMRPELASAADGKAGEALSGAGS